MFELVIITALSVAPIQLSIHKSRAACESDAATIKTYQAVLQCKPLTAEKQDDKPKTER